jgi:hypothetical protein
MGLRGILNGQLNRRRDVPIAALEQSIDSSGRSTFRFRQRRTDRFFALPDGALGFRDA